MDRLKLKTWSSITVKEKKKLEKFFKQHGMKTKFFVKHTIIGGGKKGDNKLKYSRSMFLDAFNNNNFREDLLADIRAFYLEHQTEPV